MMEGKESEVHSVQSFSAPQGDDQESNSELVLFHVKECYVYMVWTPFNVPEIDWNLSWIRFSNRELLVLVLFLDLQLLRLKLPRC